MPERDGYIPGVPCWIDTSQPDPEAAVGFYTDLFGWEFEDVMPPDSPGKYFVARLGGGDVAAVGSVPESAPQAAMWNTYIWVDNADEAAAKVKGAGVEGDEHGEGAGARDRHPMDGEAVGQGGRDDLGHGGQR